MKAEWPKRLEYKSFLYFGTFYSLFHTRMRLTHMCAKAFAGQMSKQVINE